MKSYFKFLSRNKLYTGIVASGLIISIAFIILTGNYVWQQYSIAYSNQLSDRVYAVGSDEWAALSFDDKKLLEAELPEAVAVTRYGNGNFALLINDERFEGRHLQIDKEFFEVFPEWRIVEGDLDTFGNGATALVSRELYETYLKDKNYHIGDSLQLATNHKIIGIFEHDETIACDADILINFKEYPGMTPFSIIGGCMTFVKTDGNSTQDELLEKISAIERPHYSESFIKKFRVYSLPELYFSDNQGQLKSGNRTLLHILLAVVVLLLISSIINYINLTMALVTGRSKEMATRRLNGATRYETIRRLITESILFVGICTAIAIGLAYLIVPSIDGLLQNISTFSTKYEWRYIHLEIRWSLASIFILTGFVIILGFLAGLLPALFSSSFKPIDIVRGSFRRKNKMTFGKIFIVFQNILSVLLIALSIVMEAQLHHMLNRPLNARTNNLYYLQINYPNYDAIAPYIEKLNMIPGIGRIGLGNCYPGTINMTKNMIDNDVIYNVGVLYGDSIYFNLMGLNILSENTTKGGAGIIYFSESIANSLNINNDEPLPESFRDFDFNDNHADRYGGIYVNVPLRPADTDNADNFSAFILTDRFHLLNGGNVLIEVMSESPELEDKILNAYKEFCIEEYGIDRAPWDKGFVSQKDAKVLTPVRTTVYLMEIFMFLSLLISLLGLIAMSSNFSNENTKVIAIRKVLGSNVSMEIRRNIRLYMILVVISIVIAIPLAVYIAREYLSKFAYRIENYWWIFVLAAVISILVAFLSVYWQISKAAHTDPATELKKE